MRKESLKRDNTTDSSQGDNSDADDNEQTLSNGRNDASSASNGDGIDPFDAMVASKPPTSSKPNSITAGNVSPVDSPSASPTHDAPSATDGDNANDSADGAARDGDDEPDGGYEVDEIVDHQYKGKSKKLYKIRWKNYGPEDDTWEPEDSLSCPELIEKYLETHPDTRPPKKEKKPKKVKPVVDAVPRDTPKRVSAKSAIVESDDGGASVDSMKKSKKAGPKKTKKKPTEVYEVEKIVEDRQGNKGETIFRIRWKGYRAQQDTWEPEAFLSCDDLIKKYWANKKKTAKPEVDTTEYEVEKIVGHMVERGQVMYCVKWKGYGEDANTWELASTVHCPDLIDAYKQKYFATPATNGKPKTATKRPSADTKKNKSSPPAPKKKKKAPKIVPDDTDDDDDDVPDENESEAGDRDPLEDTTEKEWEVEDVVDERTLRGKKEYLIRWKGCKADQDTWEPAQNVNCPGIIAKFEKKQASAAKKSPGEKQGKRVSIKLPSTPRKSSRRA